VKIKTIILATLSLMSCQTSATDTDNYCKITDHLIKEYIHQIRTKLDLNIMGWGGAMLDNVKGIYIDFTCSNSATFEEARELLVKAVDTLLTIINSSEEIRPYLANYPFTDKNLRLGILFPSTQDPKGKVKRIYLFEGKTIFYKQIEGERRAKDFTESYTKTKQLSAIPAEA